MQVPAAPDGWPVHEVAAAVVRDGGGLVLVGWAEHDPDFARNRSSSLSAQRCAFGLYDPESNSWMRVERLNATAEYAWSLNPTVTSQGDVLCSRFGSAPAGMPFPYVGEIVSSTMLSRDGPLQWTPLTRELDVFPDLPKATRGPSGELLVAWARWRAADPGSGPQMMLYSSAEGLSRPLPGGGGADGAWAAGTTFSWTNATHTCALSDAWVGVLTCFAPVDPLPLTTTGAGAEVLGATAAHETGKSIVYRRSGSTFAPVLSQSNSTMLSFAADGSVAMWTEQSRGVARTMMARLDQAVPAATVLSANAAALPRYIGVQQAPLGESAGVAVVWQGTAQEPDNASLFFFEF